MSVLPDLARYDRFGIDTETTGVTWADVPVGLSIATPDRQRFYFAWGHEGGGNNVSLPEVQSWARQELARPNQLKVFYNQAFDEGKLRRIGVRIGGRREDAMAIGPLLDENDPVGFSLGAQAKKYLGEEKSDEYLNEWCAAQFGGRANRSAQAKNYWRVPYDVMREYAEFDPDLTLRLYDLRRPLIAKEEVEKIYQLETSLVPILVQMRETGVRIDLDRTATVQEGLEKKLEQLLLRWEAFAGTGVNPLSTDQVAPVFIAAGIPVKKTALGNWSIEKTDLEALAEEHDGAALLLAVRETGKLVGTFIKSQILGNVDEAGLVHCDFHQLPSERGGAKTGRFSASDPNLQFFPGDRFPDAQRLVRGLFIPYEKGQDWYKADYSQIEYRFLAHYAGGILAERYRLEPDVDFHELLTRMIYPADLLADPAQFKLLRRRTKNTNFAIVYGAGVKKAAATAGVSVQEMQGVLDLYHLRTGGLIKRLQEKATNRANARGYIVTWGGRKLRFMDVATARAKGWKVYPGEKFVGTYKSLNYLLQGSAADLIKLAIVNVADPSVVDWTNTHMHLTVHDELGFSGPPRASEAGATFEKRLHEAMADVFPLTSGVPIKVEIAAYPNWGNNAWEGQG